MQQALAYRPSADAAGSCSYLSDGMSPLVVHEHLIRAAAALLLVQASRSAITRVDSECGRTPTNRRTECRRYKRRYRREMAVSASVALVRMRCCSVCAAAQAQGTTGAATSELLVCTDCMHCVQHTELVASRDVT